MKEPFNRVSDHLGLAPEVLAEGKRHVAELAYELKMEQSQVRDFSELLANHSIKNADEATQSQWEAETRKTLRDTYGDEAQSRLAATKEYLATKPHWQRALSKTGIGSNPRVVLTLVERVDALIRSGKFKPKGRGHG
jgi:hypothetical protein